MSDNFSKQVLLEDLKLLALLYYIYLFFISRLLNFYPLLQDLEAILAKYLNAIEAPVIEFTWNRGFYSF